MSSQHPLSLNFMNLSMALCNVLAESHRRSRKITEDHGIFRKVPEDSKEGFGKPWKVIENAGKC
jgi:hypothetical protein